MPPIRKLFAIKPLAPFGKKEPTLLSLPVPYSILNSSCGVREYEPELALAARMLLSVCFSAPRDRGTTTPSSFNPHLPSRFDSSEVRLVNSATVILYGSTVWLATWYNNVRITPFFPAVMPSNEAACCKNDYNLQHAI